MTHARDMPYNLRPRDAVIDPVANHFATYPYGHDPALDTELGTRAYHRLICENDDGWGAWTDPTIFEMTFGLQQRHARDYNPLFIPQQRQPSEPAGSRGTALNTRSHSSFSRPSNSSSTQPIR